MPDSFTENLAFLIAVLGVVTVTWCGFDFGGCGWVMFSFVSATGW